jgi:hypothetical protein
LETFANRRGRSAQQGLAAALAVLITAACETPPPGGPTVADIQGAKTKGEMLRLTTLEPARCSWSRPGFELCVWQFGDRQSAWYALAASIATHYRVNLLCELPTDGTPRDRDCLVLRAASPPTTSSSKHRLRISASEAQSRLDAATTVWQVSQLVGDAPLRCSALDPSTQFCIWQANTRTEGFAVLVKLLDSRARVRLSCSFPADGSPRTAGTCRAEPG